MSEQEKISLIEKIDRGLKRSYEELVRRKAALGQDMVVANTDGQPLIVPAAEILRQMDGHKSES